MIWFWVFMLIMNLLIPLTMIGAGLYFQKSGPGNINMLLGYRTKRSMRNQDTWLFAQHHCGHIWLRCGIVMLPVSIIAMILLLVLGHGDIDSTGLWSAIISLVQVAVLLLSIIPTELALKRNFDQYGRRIQ